jgi:YD repeat-containing protein
MGQTTTIGYDDTQRLTSLTRELGDIYPSGTETTTYEYDDYGYPKSVTPPHKGKEYLFYDQAMGKLVRKTLPAGEDCSYTYDSSSGALLIISKSCQNSPEDPVHLLTARYVYNFDLDGQHQGTRVLRFIISPTGAVTEYRYDMYGCCNYEFHYLQNNYDTSALQPTQVPTLEEMQSWAGKQDPAEKLIYYYGHDKRGQVNYTTKYAEIDSNGNGLADGHESTTSTVWSSFGKKLEQSERQIGTTQAKTTCSYDGLCRPTSLIKANGVAELEQTFSVTYSDTTKQRSITSPNGEKTVETWDSLGNTSRMELAAQGANGCENRLFNVMRDRLGRVGQITKPNNLMQVDFYDRQNRIIYSVSSGGCVIGYTYDRTNCYAQKTSYINPIPMDELVSIPGVLPSISVLQALLKPDAAKDRSNYKFFDKSGKLQYVVDGNLALTENQYDLAGRKKAVIKYANKINSEQLEQLKSGKGLTLVVGQLDRMTQFFYDDASNLIGEQDGAGYLVEYKKDPAYRTVETIKYATPAARGLTLDKVRPAASEKDAHTYYYYDGLDRCTAEIDAEGYMIEREFLPNSKPSKIIRYAKKAQMSNLWAPGAKLNDIDLVGPDPSPEDQTTLYNYDLLERVIHEDLPFAVAKDKTYDLANKVTLDSTSDKKGVKETRRTLYSYDQWEQVIAKCPPLIAKILADIDADPNSNSQDKEEKKKQVWQTQSYRSVYDSSGLLMREIDPLGNTTLYYYDADHNLRYTVNPLGGVVENIYNAFHEVTTLRKYVNRVNSQQLLQLTGGLLTDTIQQTFDGIKNNDKDALTKYTQDNMGKVIMQVDPEGYISQFDFNSFGECETEHKPMAEMTPSIDVSHTFENRGLEVQTKTESQGLSVAKSYEFANPDGMCTATTDELGLTQLTTYDKLDRATKVILPLGTVRQKSYDSFNRPEIEVNALGDCILHQYNQEERRHVKVICDGEVRKSPWQSEVSDAFGEVITRTDALGHQTKTTYAPDGQVTSVTDPLGNVTQDEYDLCGLQITHISPDKVTTKFERDACGNVKTKVVDPAVKAITTSSTFTAQNQEQKRTDPNGVLYQELFDRKGLSVMVEVDPRSESNPSGLGLLQSTTYNGQRQQDSVVQGDNADPMQRITLAAIDPLNRKVGEILDPKDDKVNPDGLNIAKSQHLNAKNQIIANIDPNGNITRYFYDELGNQCITVNPKGGIIEYSFDKENHQTLERDYATAIDFSKLDDSTDLKTVKAMLIKSDEDKLNYKFYNYAGVVVYTVNSFGVITEKVYDSAMRETATIVHANPLDPSVFNDLDNLTTDSLAKCIVPSDDDRTTYHVYDSKGQECYTIDPRGVLTEQKYDACGRVIVKVAYATFIADPKAFSQLPFEQIEVNIPKDNDNDRYTYQGFNVLGKLSFAVNSEGAVTKYDYDANGNLKQTSCFTAPIKVPANSYEDLVATVNSLNPDAAKGDRVTIDQYDSFNRKISEIDALCNKDVYEVDALGHVVTHIDRNSAPWGTEYDGAGRQCASVSPPIDYYILGAAGKQLEKLMAAKVTKKITLDANGNQTQIIFGFGTENPRTVNFHYDTNNKLDNVSIDNVALSATSDPVTVASSVVYNAKDLKVVEQNEVKALTFYVYDAENQLRYQVDALGGVTKFDRDSFGEIIRQTNYASPLQDIDLNQYAATGLTASLIEQYLVTSVDDRFQEFSYDKQGNKTSVKKNPVFYFIPDPENPLLEIAQPKTDYQYNAFHDVVYQSVLIDPQGAFSETTTFVNRMGNTLAVVAPDNGVKRYYVDAFGAEIKRTEYAKALAERPAPQTPLSEIDAAIEPDAKDRTYWKEYDLLGQKTVDGEWQALRQGLTFGPGNVPDYYDLPLQNVAARYQYSPTQKQVAVTDKYGKTAFTYFNLRGDKIAETHVPRLYTAEVGTTTTLIPLTYYFPDQFGQVVATTKYKQGTSSADALTLPAPVAEDPEDQTSYARYNSRGFAVVKTDAEGNVVNCDYTPTGQLTSQSTTVHEWARDGENYALQLHTYSQIYQYDFLNHKLLQQNLRDGDAQLTTACVYNAFGEQIGEGPGDGTYPKFFMRDPLGNSWMDNASGGVATIKLFNLANCQTAQIQSAVNDITTLTYQTLPEILIWDVSQAERSYAYLDSSGRTIASTTPAYYAPSDVLIVPIKYATYDVWGNVTEMTDTLGYVTTQSYNSSNLPLVKVQPQVTAVDEHGNSYQINLVTSYGYDFLDNQIGTRDPNDHTRVSVLDSASQLIQDVAADGSVVKTSGFDALGRVRWYRDSRGGKAWYQDFDRCDRVVKITAPSGKTQVFTYTEVGQRRSSTNGASETTRYNYDLNGNAINTFLPLGQLTVCQYDRTGQTIYMQNGNGTVTWQRDSFGRENSSTDLSGAIYTIARDFKGQVVHEYSEGGDHGQMTPFDPRYTGDGDVRFHVYDTTSTPSKDISYAFVAGQLRQITDNGTGIVTTQEYDTENRVINVSTRMLQHETAISDIKTDYDSVGRVVRNTDLNSIFEISYDPKGNRRSVLLTVQASDGTATRTSWWTYDAADRVLINDGVMGADGIIKINLDQGQSFGYASDFRVTQVDVDTYYGAERQFDTSTLTYDDDGLLVRTDTVYECFNQFKPGAATRVYDGANRLQHYIKDRPAFHTESHGHKHDKASTHEESVTTYNANGWQTEVTQNENGSKSDGTFDQYTDEGQLIHQVMNFSGNTDDLTSKYTRFKELQLAEISGTRHNSNGTGPIGKVTEQYDSNGVTERVHGDENADNNALYTPTTTGQLLMKWPDHGLIPDGTVPLTIYLYAADRTVLGSYSAHYSPKTNRVYFHDGVTLKIDLSYAQPVTDTFPPPSPGSAIVLEGDTFSTISERCYGYAGYAGIIAAANGYDATDALSVGMTLKIPALVPSINSSVASIPYQKLESLIIGSLYPHLKTPQPPQKHHSFFEEIVDVVVTVVVVAVGVALAAPTGGASLTFSAVAASVGIGITAGMAASIVTQGLAIGVFSSQDSFSFTSMLEEGAVTGAALGAGTAFGVSIGKAMGETIGEANLATAYTAACTATTSQVTALALGMTNKIDLSAIASQVVGALTGAQLKGAGPAVEAAGQTLATTAIDAIAGKPLDVANVAATYAGNYAADATAPYAAEQKQKGQQTALMTNQNSTKIAANQAFFESPSYRKAANQASISMTTVGTSDSGGNNAIASGVSQALAPQNVFTTAATSEIIAKNASAANAPEFSEAAAPTSLAPSYMPSSDETMIMRDMGMSSAYYGGLNQQAALAWQGVNISDPYRMTAYPSATGTYYPSSIVQTGCVNPGTSKSSMFGSGNASTAGTSTFSDTIVGKSNEPLFTSDALQVDGYYMKTISVGNDSTEEIIDLQSEKPLSVVKEGTFFNVSAGMDGSITYGTSMLSFGSTLDGRNIIDVSVPWFGSSAGVTFYYKPISLPDIISQVGNVPMNPSAAFPTFQVLKPLPFFP